MESQEFPRRFGKYILLDLLNAGGMAQVFLARVTGIESFQRLIAIKCIRPDLAADEQFSSMFIDEANLAGQLMHPNIAQIYELGRYKDQLYIAMELIDGRDLRHIVRRASDRGVEIPIGFAAYVISKAAEGLDYAHRKTGPGGRPLHLVHRDVSPQNILVTYDGAVKVVDFGIAKANQRTSQTSPGILKGKFSYMAPEQVRGKPIDRRADIFTLGSVLYEVLRGRKLFDGETDLEVVEKVRSTRLPDMRATFPEAPPELFTVLSQTLIKSRSKRFQYASELAKALEPLLIRDRSIFGAQDAAGLMRELFAEEIATGTRSNFDEVDDFGSEPSKRNQVVFASHFDDLPEGDPWQMPTVALSTTRRPTDKSDLSKLRTDERDFPDDEREEDDSDLWDLETDERIRKEQLVAAMSSGPKEFDPQQQRSGPLALLATLGLVVGAIFVLVWGAGDPETDTDPDPPPAATKAARADWGFVTVRVQGARNVRVFIDGRDIGRAPVNSHRLKAGVHSIKVVEQRRGRPVKTKVKKVNVDGNTTRRAPEIVIFSL